MIEVCLCGHSVYEHTVEMFSLVAYCDKCYGEYFIHKFKLDNLSYIEQLAKDKGLV